MDQRNENSKIPEFAWYLVLGPPILIGLGALAGYNTGGVGANGPDAITFAILALELLAGWILGLIAYFAVRVMRRLRKYGTSN